MTDLAFTRAAELARLIARRALSPVELVDMVLARIERAQPTLNPFITVTAEPARAAARAAETALMGRCLGAALRRAVLGQGPRQHRGSADDLRLGGARRQRPFGRLGRG